MEIASKYQEIIREVIKNVSAEFTAEHVNGEVLKQLEKARTLQALVSRS